MTFCTKQIMNRRSKDALVALLLGVVLTALSLFIRSPYGNVGTAYGFPMPMYCVISGEKWGGADKIRPQFQCVAFNIPLWTCVAWLGLVLWNGRTKKKDGVQNNTPDDFRR